MSQFKTQFQARFVAAALMLSLIASLKPGFIFGMSPVLARVAAQAKVLSPYAKSARRTITQLPTTLKTSAVTSGAAAIVTTPSVMSSAQRYNHGRLLAATVLAAGAGLTYASCATDPVDELLTRNLIAKVPVPEKYSINLMWLNRELKPEQAYIYPAKNVHELDKKLTEPLLSWSAQNPGCPVNLWYDSQTTTLTAVKNTAAQLIKAQLRSHNCGSINLKDIRELQFVRDNPHCFRPELAVYFRADLARLMASLEMAEQQPDHCFVYADLDLSAMPKTQLFNAKTNQQLAHYGLTLANRAAIELYDLYNMQFHFYKCQQISKLGDCAGLVENSLIILNPNKKSMLTALNESVIRPSILHGMQSIWPKTHRTGGFVYACLITYLWHNFLVTEYIARKKIKSSDTYWADYEPIKRSGIGLTCKDRGFSIIKGHYGDM